MFTFQPSTTTHAYSVKISSTTTTSAPTTVTTTTASVQTVLPINLKTANNGSLETVVFQTRPTTVSTTTTTTTTTSTTTATTSPALDTPCLCPLIHINSTHRATVEKHGTQLGTYLLHDAKAGRPIYRHEQRDQERGETELKSERKRPFLIHFI